MVLISSSARRITAWEGLYLEYRPSFAILMPRSLIVGIAIADSSLISSIQPNQHTDLLLILSANSLIDYLERQITQSIASLALPFQHYCTINNPSLLHLLQLLQSEIENPQPMNRLFIRSIVTVLIIHLLQQWQGEYLASHI